MNGGFVFVNGVLAPDVVAEVAVVELDKWGAGYSVREYFYLIIKPTCILLADFFLPPLFDRRLEWIWLLPRICRPWLGRRRILCVTLTRRQVRRRCRWRLDLLH